MLLFSSVLHELAYAICYSVEHASEKVSQCIRAKDVKSLELDKLHHKTDSQLKEERILAPVIFLLGKLSATDRGILSSEVLNETEKP
jgi:hypothetical protein